MRCRICNGAAGQGLLAKGMICGPCRAKDRELAEQMTEQPTAQGPPSAGDGGG